MAERTVEAQNTEQVPSVGRVVHYVLPHGRYAGEHRPAIIVKVWDESPTPTSLCQLQVFTDGQELGNTNDGLPHPMWCTSVHQGTEPGTWHWPEYVPPVAAN